MQLNSSLNKLDIPGWMKFGMNQICMEMGNQWMKRNEGPDGAATEGNRANSLTANNQVNEKPETDDRDLEVCTQVTKHLFWKYAPMFYITFYLYNNL